MKREVNPRLMKAVARTVPVAALLFVLGCSGPANKYDSVVTGTVTVAGELAKAGTVTFHPVNKGPAAIGRVNSDGSYSLRTGQGDLSHADGGTVVSGDYLVTASITGPGAAGEVVSEGGPPKPGSSLINKKYATKDTTDLRHTVKPGQQVIVLEFQGAEAEVVADSAASEAPIPPRSEEKTEAPKEKNDTPATAEPATERPAAGPEK